MFFITSVLSFFSISLLTKRDRFRLTEGPYNGSEGKGKGVKYPENEKYLVCRGKETEENIWSVEEKKNRYVTDP